MQQSLAIYQSLDMLLGKQKKPEDHSMPWTQSRLLKISQTTSSQITLTIRHLRWIRLVCTPGVHRAMMAVWVFVLRALKQCHWMKLWFSRTWSASSDGYRSLRPREKKSRVYLEIKKWVCQRAKQWQNHLKDTRRRRRNRYLALRMNPPASHQRKVHTYFWSSRWTS